MPKNIKIVSNTQIKKPKIEKIVSELEKLLTKPPKTHIDLTNIDSQDFLKEFLRPFEGSASGPSSCSESSTSSRPSASSYSTTVTMEQLEEYNRQMTERYNQSYNNQQSWSLLYDKTCAVAEETKQIGAREKTLFEEQKQLTKQKENLNFQFVSYQTDMLKIYNCSALKLFVEGRSSGIATPDNITRITDFEAALFNQFISVSNGIKQLMLLSACEQSAINVYNKFVSIKQCEAAGICKNTGQQNSENKMWMQHRQIRITGAAGTGKAMTIKVMMEIYNTFCNTDGFCIAYIACASTGKAAVAIDGTTVHAALRISLSKLLPLKIENAHQYRSLFQHVIVIIIDDISMVGAQLLEQIDQRLKQIT
ncbi:unnamed protein product [Diabrotica balteata]|uniref:ATP-dependent DNA helicase n=1 Tax=Diabrotica balteata TaxID=107213 RepID=A0A9N9TFY0_DIABA|nr:unnamed protein product [Diabrotica balteata]